MTVYEFVSGATSTLRVSGQFASVALGAGEFSATSFGPVGALFALIILWHSELRRSVPFVAAVTVATGGVCGALPWPTGSGPAQFFVSPLATLFVGVLAMIHASMRWPREGARVAADPTCAPPEPAAGADRA